MPIKRGKIFETAVNRPALLRHYRGGHQRCLRLIRSNPQYKLIHLAGSQVYLYSSVLSTNNTAKALAQAGSPDGTLVVAEQQGEGRGRKGRQWLCPPGRGILMSLILKPQMELGLLPLLTLLTAVVVVQTIRNTTACPAGIKWPNDIIIGNKKVCGILAESSINSPGSLEYIVIGIGINVNQELSELPPDCQESSTSLKLVLGHRVSRLQIIKSFISTWQQHYNTFLVQGYPYLRSKWLENDQTLGKVVSIGRESNAVEGLALDISERGGLIVELSGGARREFLAEELSLGRNFYSPD